MLHVPAEGVRHTHTCGNDKAGSAKGKRYNHGADSADNSLWTHARTHEQNNTTHKQPVADTQRCVFRKETFNDAAPCSTSVWSETRDGGYDIDGFSVAMVEDCFSVHVRGIKRLARTQRL